jgi:hypothetical protein
MVYTPVSKTVELDRAVPLKLFRKKLNVPGTPPLTVVPVMKFANVVSYTNDEMFGKVRVVGCFVTVIVSLVDAVA